MDEIERSLERITDRDLRRLGQLALQNLDEVFARCSVAGLYRDRLILLALCQGAAKHFVDGENGIKDFDVWAFFRASPLKPFPYRTVWNIDFGPSEFRKHPGDEGYKGRRVDVIGRSIRAANGSEEAVRNWLQGGSASASHLSRKPVVGLYPDPFFAKVVWSPEAILADGA